MKAFLVLSFMVFLLNAHAEVDLQSFAGTFELISSKGSNFRQPEPYCAKKLEVDYDSRGMARGLHFTDIDGDWLTASHYISQHIITKGRSVSDKTEETLTMTSDTLTHTFDLNRGMESYQSIKIFKFNGNQLIISEKLRGKMNLFNSKLDCTYRRM